MFVLGGVHAIYDPMNPTLQCEIIEKKGNPTTSLSFMKQPQIFGGLVLFMRFFSSEFFLPPLQHLSYLFPSPVTVYSRHPTGLPPRPPKKNKLVGGFLPPIWKICKPQGSGWKFKKKMKPPPRFCDFYMYILPKSCEQVRFWTLQKRTTLQKTTHSFAGKACSLRTSQTWQSGRKRTKTQRG